MIEIVWKGISSIGHIPLSIGIAYAITIAIPLLRVRRRHAVVAEVAEAVFIHVDLVRVANLNAVVTTVAYAVLVRVDLSRVRQVDADVALELGSRDAAKAAKQLRVPMLVQIADFDRSAPPRAAAKAAFNARAEVRHYPCDHFDVYEGKEWFGPASAHQVSFLTRVLAP